MSVLSVCQTKQTPSPEWVCFAGRRDSVAASREQVRSTCAEGIPGVQAEWKPRVDAWPCSTRGAEADVGFFRIPGSRDTYVDAVCSYANPQTYRGCESTAGTVAELKARQKNADHPVFDANNRRRLHPFDFCALSFERHGDWAKETVGFTKNLPTRERPQLLVLNLLRKFAVGTE